jgi:3-oxocholest-4-en-26-oyl-CoA dehydrogenase beta subunit
VDFDFSEEQQDLQNLAKQILEGELTNERLREIDAGGDRFDRDLWGTLAEAGLLGVAVPEAQGGLGYGFLEVALVLEQIGRTVAPLPYLATVVLGGLPIAQFGTDAQRDAWLPGVVSGETVLTAALVEFGADPLAPQTTATRDGDGWVLDGQKDCVPAGLVAARVLVPAATDDGGIVLALVDPTADGVTRERQDTTNFDP